MPEIITNQQLTVDVERRDVLEHPAYHRFKHIMTFWIGVPAILTILILGGFFLGRGCSPAKAPTPQAKSEQPTQAQATVTIPGIDRLTTAMEKAAEAKPPTAMVNATSAAVASTTTKMGVPMPKVVVTVPGIDRLAMAVEKLQTPPQPIPQASPADPTAGMTTAQRCDYEIIVLRKASCQ